jgi:hypothetical protein
MMPTINEETGEVDFTHEHEKKNKILFYKKLAKLNISSILG